MVRRFRAGAHYSDAPARPPTAMDKYAEAIGAQLAGGMPPGGRFLVLLYEDAGPDIASCTNAQSPEQLQEIIARAYVGLELIALQDGRGPGSSEPPS